LYQKKSKSVMVIRGGDAVGLAKSSQRVDNGQGSHGAEVSQKLEKAKKAM